MSEATDHRLEPVEPVEPPTPAAPATPAAPDGPRAEAQISLGDLDTLMDLIPDAALATDGSGRIRAANELTATLFGYELAELVGSPLGLLVPERVRALHDAQQRQYIRSPHVRRMGAGLDLSGRRSDGSEFPVDVSLAPVVTEAGTMAVATIRDLTERRREQAAEAHLAAIVESTTDAIAATDLDGTVTSWNPGAERLLGFSAAEMIGRPIFIVVAEEFRTSLARARQRILAGETVAPFESRRVHKAGRLVDVEVTLSAIHDRNGTLLGVSGVFRDITERREAEAERAVAQREHEQLRMLAERERIARELHDVVIQRVFAAGLSLTAAAGLADDEVATRLHRVIDELDTITTDIRTTIFDLEAHRGPSASPRHRVLDLAAEASPTLGHDVVVRWHGADDLPPETVEELLAVLREALSSVARHAHATATMVEVVVGPSLVLTVTDNGVGPDTPEREGGLASLGARTELLGGRLDVRRGHRGGTHLEWVLPLPNREAGGERSDRV